MVRLERSYYLHYLALKDHYEVQLRNYCGVASSVIVLNALGICDQPYTQHTFFTEQVLTITTPEKVSQQGFSFEELTDCLNTFPQVHAEGFYGDQFKTPDDLGNALAQLMSSNQAYIIANFSRPALGQKGGGHISPLVAIDEESRSVLVLDVNRHYGPYWLDLDLLWKSMQRCDDARNFPRGFIIVSRD